MPLFTDNDPDVSHSAIRGIYNMHQTMWPLGGDVNTDTLTAEGVSHPLFPLPCLFFLFLRFISSLCGSRPDFR